ncbi:C-type lectin lectoxin-Phi1-like [Pituophis catenifer annectens]|uniref:C-type lectin lectoxin-Phi1-like n=1 Tax=Pituophis catenifer annectens TaxID=94852 RepID=UPI00399123EA
MLLITCFIFGLLGSLTWAAGPHARTLCPSGTFAYKDGSEWNCFKFYEDQFTFEDAEQECQFRWKGHLASFKSDKQTKSVGAYVSKESIERGCVWIGLRRDAGSSVTTGWRWVDGSRDTYRKWGYNEPNNLGNNVYCTCLHSSSGYLTWIDIDCNNRLNFLCKWKPS